MADTTMTDNHSTDQNNNKNDKKNVTDNHDDKGDNDENGTTESTHTSNDSPKSRMTIQSSRFSLRPSARFEQ